MTGGHARDTLSVGAYEAFLLLDGVFSSAIANLTHPLDNKRASAIAGWQKPSYAADVNCLALSGPGGLVLIDAGAGEHWGPAYGRAPAALQSAGFTAEDVRVVLLTHLHGDHALGLIAGEVARYPNAEIKAPAGDIAYYGDAAKIDLTPANVRGAFRNLELLHNAYPGRVAPISPGDVLPGIEAMALPGHTPGHTGYLVRGRDAGLLAWGDVIHLDALQFQDPDIGLGFDLDPELAIQSRRFALELAAKNSWHIAGGHISGLRRIEQGGAGYAYTPEHVQG